jgi:transcriptional regulator with XRE-family HTH domain
MSAKPRRLMPATAGRTHVERVELDQFARRLHAAMNAKGLNNSDLARIVWGEAKDAKGYTVARNRDRIGVYLKGDGFPEPKTLAKLAEALDTTAEELAPEITAASVDRERPELAMTMVSGHADKVHVQVNALLPLGVAVEISRLVERAKRKPVPGVDEDLPS